jgi:Reverse transcriptase (RNA-dependent DNA polymerase)
MWRTTKKILNQPIAFPTLEKNHKQYTTDEEKCSVFATELKKTFTPNIKNRNFSRHINNYIETHVPISHTIKPTSPTEIKNIIQQLHPRKAPGHDQITNDILKLLTPKSLAFLATILNSCIRIGYFPTSWKLAHILMFHKPGKDKVNPTHYRPISLLPALSKVFEKIIHIRLTAEIDQKKIIPHNQFGFKPKHSALHQLQRLTEQIERGFEYKQYTLTAFLDIEKAFDKVWLPGLKFKPTKLQISDYLLAIIFSFLNNRNFAVKINKSLSPPEKILAGVPQGSILALTLYNIYIHDIPENTNSTIGLFADDTVITTQNPDPFLAALHLQTSLSRIIE